MNSIIDWTEAVCGEVGGNAMYPEDGETSIGQAKKVCGGCPIQGACLEAALATAPGEDWGVWGGTSKRERSRIRLDRRKAAHQAGLALAS